MTMQNLVLTDVHTHTCPAGPHAIFNFIPGRGTANPPEGAFFSAGLHPWYLDKHPEDAKNQLKAFCAHPLMLAIGETGIDKLKGPGLNVQSEVFSWHLDLADQYAMPVIIHQVRAVPEIVRIIQGRDFKQPVIIHGFRGKPAAAEAILRAGYYLSVGWATTKPSAGLAESIRIIPSERLFIETDDQPGPINNIYKAVAEIRGVAVESLAYQVFTNFKHCFKKAYGELG